MWGQGWVLVRGEEGQGDREGLWVRRDVGCGFGCSCPIVGALPLGPTQSDLLSCSDGTSFLGLLVCHQRLEAA